MTEAAAVVSKVGGMVEGMKGREGGREGEDGRNAVWYTVVEWGKEGREGGREVV